jgi:voltage-gated potassium channel
MILTNLAVRFAYFLQASKGYRRTKGFAYDLLENPHSRQRPFFDLFMITVVMVSVFLLIYDVGRDLGPFADRFEVIVVSVFASEYLLRMWLYSDSHKILIEHYEHAELLNVRFRLAPALWAIVRTKLRYMTTPLAIIDLLAILPSYRPLRFLRIFLLFRLFKLFRYTRSLNAFAKVLSEKRFELYTLGIFIGFVILIATIAIYLFEADTPGTQIHGFLDAAYWAIVTMSTVGYGDITPHTTEGRVVTVALITSGIGVLSFSTSIIVSAFTEKMRDLRENRVYAEAEKLSGLIIVCGYGRIGEVVVGRLAAAKENFVIIDEQEAAVQHARKRGFLAIQGDAADSQLLANLGLGGRARCILCLTHDDVTNLYITLTARHASSEALIISRANKHESVKKLELAGASHVVRPYEAVARMAAEYIGQPVAFDAVYGVVTGTRGIRLEPVVVHPGSSLEDRRVDELNLGPQNLTLFGVVRNLESPGSAEDEYYDLTNQHFYFNPRPAFKLHAHDILVVFGYEFSIYHFKKQLDTRRSRIWRRAK